MRCSPSPWRASRCRQLWRPGCSGAAGAVMLAVSAFAIHDSQPFPGIVALVPVAGTVLLILAGSHHTVGVSAALSAGPMVWLGDTSYSWYLWHWPVIVFTALVFPHRPALLVARGSRLPAARARVVPLARAAAAGLPSPHAPPCRRADHHDPRRADRRLRRPARRSQRRLGARAAHLRCCVSASRDRPGRTHQRVTQLRSGRRQPTVPGAGATPKATARWPAGRAAPCVPARGRQGRLRQHRSRAGALPVRARGRTRDGAARRRLPGLRPR